MMSLYSYNKGHLKYQKKLKIWYLKTITFSLIKIIILEMLLVYEKFASIFKDEIFLVPVDYPYLYQKNHSSSILIGQHYHWRSISESSTNFSTSKEYD